MSKSYSVRFGAGDPRITAGLAPTLILFFRLTDGQTLTAPAFAEGLTGTGFYTFLYGTTQPIAFLADGATTGLVGSQRYVTGQIDPDDRSDEYGNTMIALGNTLTAALPAGLGGTLTTIGTNVSNMGLTLIGLGNSSISAFSLLGSASSSFGNTMTDPSTVFGFLMRTQELFEGDQVYTKSGGLFQMFNRGSSTMLRQKTISDSASSTTKT